MVEIVVQNDDERRIECEVLLERAGALHLQCDACHGVAKRMCAPFVFFRLSAPVITDGRAVACSVSEPRLCWCTVGRLDVRGAFGEPAAPDGAISNSSWPQSVREFDSDFPLS